MRSISLRVISIVSVAAALVAGCARGAPELTEVAVADGFIAPESVVWDAPSKSWFVSSIGAQDVAGDGFISKVSADGEVLARDFITGLDDPKGIRVSDGALYVADRLQLVRVPLDSPAEVERIEVPGATFLNDVAIDRSTGDVFVSDTFGNAIFRIRDGVASELLRTPELEAPNGLLAVGGALVVASLGPDLDPMTFTTSSPGRLFHLNLETLALAPVAEIGLLDGLEALGEGFLVSDFLVGLYYVDGSGEPTLILDNATAGLGSSADIGHAPGLRRIAVPDLTSTRVRFYDYERPRD